jgi:hypothetical protein
MKTEDWMWIQRKLRQKAEAERNNVSAKQNKTKQTELYLSMFRDDSFDQVAYRKLCFLLAVAIVTLGQ